MDRRAVSSAVLAVVALLLCVPALVALSGSDDGVARSGSLVDGVPVTLLEPDPVGSAARPGVVVAHGFAGSAQLMDGIGLALARAGFVVALLDFTGHGENPGRLPVSGTSPAADVLRDDLDAVVRWLSSRPGTAAGGIGLVGHSMGAGAVVRYGVADAGSPVPLVAATVAISLPSADDLPVGRPAVPRDLLLLWGAAEQARFREAAIGGLRAAYPTGVPGETYGDPAAGTARRAVEVPGVEHISILFHPDTLRETADWLRQSVPGAGTLPPAAAPSDGRLAWVGLLSLGLAVAFVPLARLAYGRRSAGAGSPAGAAAGAGAWADAGAWAGPMPGAEAGAEAALRSWQALAVALGAAVLASLGAWAAAALAALVPLAVGGYLVLWFTASGLAATVLLTLVRRRLVSAQGHPGANRSLQTSHADSAGAAAASITGASGFPWRALLATIAMTAYAVLALGLVARHTWTAFAVVGARGWVLPIMVLAFLAYFWADERVVSGRSRLGRAALSAASRAIAIVVILGSVVLLGAPGFLTLLLPLMLVLFVLLGYYAVVVSGLTRCRWAPAVVQAVPLAFLVATTFPLVG